MKRCPSWVIVSAVWLHIVSQMAWGSSSPNSSLTDLKQNSSERIQALEQSLVVAKAEADFFRKRYQEMVLKDETWGTAEWASDIQALHEKQVHLVADFYRHQKEKQALEKTLQALVQFFEPIVAKYKKDSDSLWTDFEKALAEARLVLNQQKDWTKASVYVKNDPSSQVVFVDEPLGLVVINAGRNKDLKIGMAFHIIRQDKVIGRCKIVELRDQICGALIEEIRNNQSVQPGDRLILIATEK